MKKNKSNLNTINDNIKKYKFNQGINVEFNLNAESFDNFIKNIKLLGALNEDLYKINDLDTLILKNK